MREKVDVEANSPTRDTFGGSVDNWSATARGIWAQVTPLTGTEKLAAQQIVAEATTEIRLRFRKGVAARNRIKMGSRIFDVLYVINVEERERQLVLLCKETIS